MATGVFAQILKMTPSSMLRSSIPMSPYMKRPATRRSDVDDENDANLIIFDGAYASKLSHE